MKFINLVFGILLLSCTALALASGGSFITNGIVASLRGSLLGSTEGPFTPGSLSGLTLHVFSSEERTNLETYGTDKYGGGTFP